MEPENKLELSDKLSFDFNAREHLRSIASWAKIIVITSVIGYLFSLIQVFFTEPPKAPRATEGFDSTLPIEAASSPVWTIVSIAIGLVVNFFLFRFAAQTRIALTKYDQKELGAGFNNLKNYFIIVSIMVLVMFLIVIGFITVLVFL
jgi:hypothetical protein